MERDVHPLNQINHEKYFMKKEVAVTNNQKQINMKNPPKLLFGSGQLGVTLMTFLLFCIGLDVIYDETDMFYESLYGSSILMDHSRRAIENEGKIMQIFSIANMTVIVAFHVLFFVRNGEGLDPETNWKLYIFNAVAAINAISFCHRGQIMIDEVLHT
nr:unnamed protein product [Callosobruchus chinensis]